jgi:hypothetical protein
MDAIEINYRRTPRNPLALKSYINALYEKQHILEAKFFYDLLKDEEPAGFETNRLGYLLSIRMMDPMVAEFEKNLVRAGATQEQVYALQLYYYYTFSDLKKMRECTKCLLDLEPTEKYTYTVILESVIRLKDFELASKVIHYILPRIKPTDELLRSLRHILNVRLLCLLKIRSRI